MRIFWTGLFIISAVLCQTSFGAPQAPYTPNPPPASLLNFDTTPCNQLDAQSVAFFNWQSSERGSFMNTYPDAIKTHDLNFQYGQAIRVAQLKGWAWKNLPQPPGEDPAFSAFESKQLSDKQTFLSKFYTAKDKCNNPPPTPKVTPTPPTTTP